MELHVSTLSLSTYRSVTGDDSFGTVFWALLNSGHSLGADLARSLLMYHADTDNLATPVTTR